MKCRKCNATLLHDNIEKCPYCGEIVHNHEAFTHKKNRRCIACRAMTTTEYDMCPYCGKELVVDISEGEPTINVEQMNLRIKTLKLSLIMFLVIILLPLIIEIFAILLGK